MNRREFLKCAATAGAVATAVEFRCDFALIATLAMVAAEVGDYIGKRISACDFAAFAFGKNVLFHQ